MNRVTNVKNIPKTKFPDAKQGLTLKIAILKMVNLGLIYWLLLAQSSYEIVNG
jgi:hypothetical protein